MASYGFPSSCSYLLQMTILSAESLVMARKKPVKKNAFVIVAAANDHQTYNAEQQQQCTKYSKEGGGNPAWNEKLEISVPMHTKHITLEVRYATSLEPRGKSLSIGVARVPISDFIGNYYNKSNDYLHFLSYRLRDQFGQPNGIINFSVKVLQGLDRIQQPTGPNMYKGSTSEIEGWSGYNNKRENFAHGMNCSYSCTAVNGWINSGTPVVGVPRPSMVQ